MYSPLVCQKLNMYINLFYLWQNKNIINKLLKQMVHKSVVKWRVICSHICINVFAVLTLMEVQLESCMWFEVFSFCFFLKVINFVCQSRGWHFKTKHKTDTYDHSTNIQSAPFPLTYCCISSFSLPVCVFCWTKQTLTPWPTAADLLLRGGNPTELRHHMTPYICVTKHLN